MIHMWQHLNNQKRTIALFFIYCIVCITFTACGTAQLSIEEQATQIFNDYFMRGDVDTTIRKYETLLEQVEKNEGSNSKDEIMLMCNLGSVYIALEQYDEAEQYLQKAKTSSEVIELKEWPIDDVYFMLGQVEYHKENPEQAIEYLKEAIMWREKIFGEGSWKTEVVYLHLGYSYTKMEMLEEAEACILEGLKPTYEGMQRQNYVSGNYALGEVKMKQKNYEEATVVLKEAIKTYEIIYGDKSTRNLEIMVLVPTYSMLSEAYIALEEYEQALEAVTQCYIYAVRVPESMGLPTGYVEEYETKMFEIWKVVYNNESRSDFDSWLFNDVAH